MRSAQVRGDKHSAPRAHNFESLEAVSVARVVDLPRPFERHLRAENKSERTVETYLEAVAQLDDFLQHRELDLTEARRSDIETFLGEILAKWKPSTAANRYRALRVFYA
jgi:site-specific recombinase XerD